MITYQIKQDGIMYVTFKGNIVYNDIAQWLIEFSDIQDLPAHINLLYDFRNANLLIDMIKLIQITKKAEEATKKFNRVRTVFLIEEVDKSTYSMLFSFLDVNGKTTRKVFTTMETALDWLLNEQEGTK